MAAYKLPQGTPHDQQLREASIQQALQAAAGVPLEVARKSADIFDQLGQLEHLASPSMKSDIRVGRLMTAAAVRGALENVAINLESIADASLASQMRAEAARLAARVSESAAGAVR